MDKETKVLNKFLKSNSFGCLLTCASCGCNRFLLEYRPRKSRNIE